MIARAPLFPGKSPMDQLSMIFVVLGTPTERDWPGVSLLPAFQAFTPHTVTGGARAGLMITGRFEECLSEAVDLLAAFLQLNPLNRLPCADAAAHPYFKSGCAATAPHLLPLPKPKERARYTEQWARRAPRAAVAAVPSAAAAMVPAPTSSGGAPVSSSGG